MAYKDPKNQKEYAKRHYRANKQLYKDRARKHTDAHRIILRKYKYEYLQNHPCVDCGESDVIVLTFDHIKGVKEANIGAITQLSWGLKRFKKEIDKCVVRCANCHARKTHFERQE